jgi:hypothetical protein
MFTRTHRIGRSVYLEVLESYRDPESGRPCHHCIARWPADYSLAEAIKAARGAVKYAESTIADLQATIDGKPRRRYQCPAYKSLAREKQQLLRWSSKLADLLAVRNVLGSVPAAIKSERSKWDGDEWARYIQEGRR